MPSIKHKTLPQLMFYPHSQIIKEHRAYKNSYTPNQQIGGNVMKNYKDKWGFRVIIS